MSGAISPIQPLAASQRGAPNGAFVARHRRELSVLAAYVALLVILAIARPGFFRNEFAGTWTRAAPVVIAAAGMTLVVVARHIDISIGSQFSICGVVAGLLAKTGMPIPVVALLTLAAGGLLGAINGALVAFLRLPSIVVTLATMVILREGLRWVREGAAVRNVPARFQWFGLSQGAGEWMLIGVAGLVLALIAWGATWISAGRAVYAVGSDPEAARLAGVRPRRVVFSVFLLMGILTGLAALLNTVRFPLVDVNAGAGLELQVIAAVVVGGTAITGGRGTLVGTLVGVMLLVTIGPALTFLELRAEWERAIHGLILLAAVASDGFFGRRR